MLTLIGVKQLTDFLRTVTAASDLVDCTLVNCEIEHHPHLVQHSLVKYCKENDIHFQAYSSLGTTSDDNRLLTDPVVLELAETHQKTAAQILLRWAVQQGIGVIPKSTNPEHIRNNIDISFCLSDSEVSKLSSLDSQHHYCWNPSSVA